MTLITGKTIRCIGVAAIAGLAALTVYGSGAFAVPKIVKSACLNDYLSYCSNHRPNTPGLTRCMRRNGTKLSRRCVSALIKTGYVSRAEVRRRAARARLRKRR